MNLKTSFDLISDERPFVNPNRGLFSFFFSFLFFCLLLHFFTKKSTKNAKYKGFLVHLASAEEKLGCLPRSKVIVDEKNPRKLPTIEEEKE